MKIIYGKAFFINSKFKIQDSKFKKINSCKSVYCFSFFVHLAPITNRRQLAHISYLISHHLSFGRYAILAGILLMALEGHVLAMEQSLQFTHISCWICIWSEPFPKCPQPFTHFAQPSQRSLLIVYSKYGSSTNFLVIAPVGHNWFSAPVLIVFAPCLRYPPQRSQ